jgi:hypothetical protein
MPSSSLGLRYSWSAEPACAGWARAELLRRVEDAEQGLESDRQVEGITRQQKQPDRGIAPGRAATKEIPRSP